MKRQRTICVVDYDAIVFDLGNTLVPWGEPQSRALYGALERTVTAALGPQPDFLARVLQLRDAVLARKHGTMRETSVAEFVGAFCGGTVPDGLAGAVAETVHTTFLDVAHLPDGVRGLLERLGERYRLALLSNFFLTSPVEALLDRDGIRDLFAHVEVSATHGFLKPHPAPFQTVRERLGTRAERTLMVGDDFWADIVGGHRAGFRTAQTLQHRTDVTGDPRAPGIRADRILTSLRELE